MIAAREWNIRTSVPSGATASTRVRSAACWSASCITPKHASTTTSARRPSGTAANPWPARPSSQVPPCGLGNSTAVPPPGGSTPAAATAAIAARRCSVSAAGSRPSTSSGTTVSSASCASPHRAHSHIRSGYTGSGPASPTSGNSSDEGWWPRSSTIRPSSLPQKRQVGFSTAPIVAHRGGA